MKKIALIPGWMNKSGMYCGKEKLYEVLEVWEKMISPQNKIQTDWIIGHSLGCNYILFSWRKNKKLKLILVNPLLPKRNLAIWFSKWIKFKFEESKPRNKQVISGIKEKCFGIKWCWRLLRKDFDKILNEIPKDRIKIICGEKDFFYCDEKFRKYVQSKGIEILEIKNVGHDWNKKFDKEIEKIINKDRE